MNLEGSVSIVDGLMITFFSMLIVFITLIIIAFLLEGFKFFFQKETPTEKKTKQPAQQGKPSAKEEENELLAVIAAALENYQGEAISHEDQLAEMAAAIEGREVKTIDRLNIKRITKIDD